jgi:hypothetical protein
VKTFLTIAYFNGSPEIMIPTSGKKSLASLNEHAMTASNKKARVFDFSSKVHPKTPSSKNVSGFGTNKKPRLEDSILKIYLN